MRISDWSSDVCSSDLDQLVKQGISSVQDLTKAVPGLTYARSAFGTPVFTLRGVGYFDTALAASPAVSVYVDQAPLSFSALPGIGVRSEEHTSELQSLMRISYAVFCLKKKNINTTPHKPH